MSNTHVSRGIQAKAADTLIIENRLRSTKPGDLVTYDELTKILGRDVREFCSGYVITARKVLVGESIFFDTVKNEGYLRLTDEEACSVSTDFIKRARNAARRGITHLRNVPFDGLSEEGKKRHLTSSAQLGAIHLFGGSKAAKKIEGKAVDAQPIAIGETLKLFGG